MSGRRMVTRTRSLWKSIADGAQWKKELAARGKVPAAFARDVDQYSPRLLRSLSKLDKLVDWERRTRVVGEQRLMRVNSSPCLDLLQKLGNPHRNFRTVHVTGSKGKGSVAMLVAASLRREGFHTGCLCSPHVDRVNERILIDLDEVEDDLLADGVDEVLSVRDQYGLQSSTWFDVLTAVGLTILGRSNVEWGVVEVGLGGHLDSTNVLDSEICVITNIMLEHEAIIGPERVDIAREKAGIIRRESATVVTGVDPTDTAVAQEIIERAERVKARPVLFVDTKGVDLTNEERNFRIAAAVINDLGRRGLKSKRTNLPMDGAILDDDVLSLAKMRLKGRMEPFTVGNVEVIVDGAHVAESVQAAIVEATKLKGAPPFALLIGLGSDKDTSAIAQRVLQCGHPIPVIICTRIGDDVRYLSASDMKEAFDGLDRTRKTMAIENPEKALQEAVDLAASQSGYVLVVGSLHLAGVVRKVIQGRRQQ